MDKRRVARIPSIFDSDDEEEDTSQTTVFSPKDNSDGETHCKSPVAGQSCVEESTSRVACEEKEDISDVGDEDKSENGSKHDESKSSAKDNDGDNEQDALETDEEQESRNFEEVTDRDSAPSYNEEDEEMVEEEESEISREKDSSNTVNEVEEEREPLDEDVGMEGKGNDFDANDSNDDSAGEIEDNENMVDEESLSGEDINEKGDEDSEEELVSAEGNEVDKDNQEEVDDEMENLDDVEEDLNDAEEDLNDAEENPEEMEEAEDSDDEMEEEDGINSGMNDDEIKAVTGDSEEDSLTDEEEETSLVENEASYSLETSTSDKDMEEPEEVGSSGELVEDGSNSEVLEVDSNGEVVEEDGSNGELAEEIGSNGELAEEVDSNGELVEEAGSNDELDEEDGNHDERVEVVNGGDVDGEKSGNCDIADKSKGVSEAATSSVDNGKEEDYGNKDDNSDYEDGSDGYVIDLDGSGEESGPESSKLEDREDVIDSSTSSSVVSEGNSKTVESKGDSQTNLETESTNQKNDVEKSTKPVETAEGTTKFVADQSAVDRSILKDKVPVTTIRRKIPLIRVPVRVEDIFTDSEDENKKTPKGTKTNEVKDGSDAMETTPIDQDNQKEVSDSPQSKSIDPESLSSDSTAEANSSKGERPRIWVSSTLFDRKNTHKSVDKPPVEAVHVIKPVRLHRSSKGFDKEKCIFALKQGWRREMVQRATVDSNTPNRVRADVYYYTPEGKKLRSRIEIEVYLMRKGVTNLTIENFTFAKEPVGGTEEQEHIRQATKSTTGSTPRRKVEVASQNAAPSESSPSIFKPVTSQKRGRPRKIPKEESPAKKLKVASTFKVPTMVVKTSLPGEHSAQSPSRYLKQIENNENKSTTFRKITMKVPEKPSQTNVEVVSSAPTKPTPTVTSTPSLKSSAPTTHKSSQNSKAETTTSSTTQRSSSSFVSKNHVVFTTKLCSSVGFPIRILTPMLSKRSGQQLFHCTGQCQLGAGTVPSLQCMKCLCLFHGKCTHMPPATVELIQSGGAKFLCPNCYKENKEKADTVKYIPPTPHELLVQDPVSSSESEDGDEQIDESAKYAPMRYVKVNFNRMFSLPTPPSSPVNIGSELDNSDISTQTGVASSSYSGLSTTTNTPSSSQSYTSSPVLNSNVPASPSPLLGVGPGGQIVQFQPPAVGGPRLIFVRPQQNIPNVQRMPQVAPRAVYFPSLGGQVPLMLSGAPGASYNATPPLYMNGSNPPTTSQLYVSSGVNYSQPISSTTLTPQPLQEKQKTPPRSHPHRKAIISQKKNFLQELSLSYQLLLRVFKYLTAKDLLVTSCVCLMWRDLSYSSALWSTLRLRNICVRNWSLLAMFLERRNTRSIDLRKMVFRMKSFSPKNEECSKEESSLDLHPTVQSTVFSSKKRHSEESYAKEDKGNQDDANSSHDNQALDLSSSYSKRESPVKEVSGCENKEPSVNDDEIATCSMKENDEEHSKNSKSPSVEAAKSSPKSTEMSTKEGLCSFGEVKESNVENISTSCNKEGSPNVDREGNEVEETNGSNPRIQSAIGDKGDNAETSSKLQSEENLVCVSSDSEEEPMEIDEDLPKDYTKVSKKVSKNEEEVLEKVNDKQQVSVDKVPYRQFTATNSSSERIRQKREGKIIVAAVSEDDTLVTKKREIDTWRHICEALGTVRCLRSVVLPPCMPEVLHLLLSNCKNITSITAADISSSSDIEFDPAYFMEAPKLKEIRIGSAQGLSFTTNFNFIKLPDLKILVIKGFAGSSWPYLGTNLTSLHLGPCHNFTHQTWINIGSMKNLRALWLEEGGTSNDNHMVEAISHLSQLRRLCLFNFMVGVKLGIALKRLTKLERLFVLQSSSGEESMGVKNHNMLAVTEHLKYVDELVWAVSSQDVKVINGVDHMHISSPKVKSYPSLSAKENASDQWPLKLIETVVKRHLPVTKVRIMKLDQAAATRMALSTL
ncbi:uncharacterized protein [Palaemon carinicauda]|uniref:uncharacterized protein n=1 Tax=Palaemon carinicauda TaxID=392227 RepID=UPI0035B5A8A5